MPPRNSEWANRPIILLSRYNQPKALTLQDTRAIQDLLLISIQRDNARPLLLHRLNQQLTRLSYD